MNILIRRRTTKAARMATAMLLLIALLSNSLLFAQAADESTGFSFAISGTTFTVMPGGATPVIASNGDGSVEIATVDEAVIWANLGGAGSGRLTDDQITGVTAGVSYAISGNTLTFTDADGGEIYQFTVRDNSASGTPVADGSTKTYDFTDGSVVSKLHDGSHRITGGNRIYSTDKLLTLTGNSGSLYAHESSHGITLSNDDQISIKVAGNATVALELCAEGAANTFSVSTSVGTVDSDSFSSKAVSDGASQIITYTGAATTLVFTYNGTGSGYLHGISVTNEAPETIEKPQTAMPQKSGAGLTVTPVGQRLTLSQSGGDLTTEQELSDTVGYYGFPASNDMYRLEADVTVTQCGSSNAYGVFLGAFDLTAKRIAVTGIRDSINLRSIYSKDEAGTLGAGGISGKITEGQTVHITASKTDDRLHVTMTPEGGETYSADLPYTNSENCQLGFALANATATVTNMVYYDADGEKLYDQNDCYDPIGQAPEVLSVQASAVGTREAIDVSWRISTAASGDGYYLLEVRHDNGDWTKIARTTETSYTYPIAEGGTYRFRVFGGLGMGEPSTGPVESETIDVVRALQTPVLTASADADSVALAWPAVPGAIGYDIYRYYDDTAVQLIYTAAADETAYTDTAVTAEVPYYYYMIARSADNWSNPSETVWAMPSAGHTGTYLPADKGAQFTLTAGTEETVFSDALALAGTVDRAGVVRAYLGDVLVGDQSVSAGGAFSYDLTLAEGSNTVTLIHTDADGSWSRAVYNYCYLPMNSASIDMIVDAAYTGTDGAQDANGIPTYRTVQAAVNAVPMDNTEEKVIFVRAGDYEERLVVSSPNITLIGEGGDTLIHCYPADFHPNDTNYEAGGDMTKRCATYIQDTATNFRAENLCFANDYVYSTPDNKDNKSADALRCDADGASFVNVTISGVQDTLYIDKGKQTFTNCRIEGLIDFIYSGDDARCSLTIVKSCLSMSQRIPRAALYAHRARQRMPTAGWYSTAAR